MQRWKLFVFRRDWAVLLLLLMGFMAALMAPVKKDSRQRWM